MNGDRVESRREWLHKAVLYAATVSLPKAIVLLPGYGAEPVTVGRSEVRIGCFNRPWMRWTYNEALDGMHSAGFQITGILGDHRGEAFTSSESNVQGLQHLRERIQNRRLTPLAGWLRTKHDVPIEMSLRQARRQIDHAHSLGLKFMLTTGVDSVDQFEHFYSVFRDLASYAEERGIQLVIKPHGGISASAEELLRCLERVNHRNFRIWYDAGNVMHYTGKDPVTDLKRLASHVTGFCAKDCAKKGGGVMLQFGTGSVDFTALFRVLKGSGFQGPVMMECCAGETVAEVTNAARENRVFLENVMKATGFC